MAGAQCSSYDNEAGVKLCKHLDLTFFGSCSGCEPYIGCETHPQSASLLWRSKKSSP